MKKSLLFITLFSISSLFGQLPNYVPLNGLIGWWPLNNNLLDYSGNMNNGSNSQTVMGTTDRFNNPNSAYSFNGTSSYITLPHDGYSTFTLSMWYYMGQALATQYPLITNSSNPASYSIFFTGTGGLQFQASWGGSYPSGISITPWAEWTHLVCIYTQTDNKLKIYKNSNLLVTHDVYDIITSPGNHIVGKLNSSHLTGKLDDIGIWNRALTQNEINNLYNSSLEIGESNMDSIAIYPNPFSDKLRINGLNSLNTKFSILNNLGIVVYNGIITSESLEIDLNFLSKGTYFLQCENSHESIKILRY
jgi:hypothetical protein